MKGLPFTIRVAALAGIVLISFSAIFFGLAGLTPITAAFFRTAYAVPVLFVLACLYGGAARGTAGKDRQAPGTPRSGTGRLSGTEVPAGADRHPRSGRSSGEPPSAWAGRPPHAGRLSGMAPWAGAGRPFRSSWLAFASGAALAIDLYLWHEAITRVGAGLATIVANIQVPLVGLGAWLLHKERPHARSFFAIPVVFLGVALISGLTLPGAFGADPIGGTLLGAAAGVCYSIFLLAFRASGRGASHPVVPLFEATLSSTVCCFLIGIVEGGLDLTLSWPAHGWLLALALGVSVAGWGLISYSITRLAALETSVMLMLQPVLTMVWAVPIFGEWVAPIQWAGAALVLAGVGYLTIKGSMRERPVAMSGIERGTEGSAPSSDGLPSSSGGRATTDLEPA